MCVVHHHVHIVYSFRTEKALPPLAFKRWGRYVGEACFSQMNILSLTVGAFSFSQKNTEEQNTQHSTEALRPADITEPYSHL